MSWISKLIGEDGTLQVNMPYVQNADGTKTPVPDPVQAQTATGVRMGFDNGFGPDTAVASASFTVLDSKGNPVTSAPVPEKKKTMLTGLPTAVVMYYAKASNTNVTLQQCISPSAPTGTKIRAHCNACHSEYKLNEQETWDFIDNPLMDSVANFASAHRHEDQGPPQKDPRIIPAKSAGSISISIAAESGERKFKDI